MLPFCCMEETPSPVRTILVAVDFADASREALRHAARLAAGLGARVVLLHVLDDAERELARAV